MISFNELRIEPSGKYLIIDASVDDGECFNDVLIDSIVIDTQNTYIANGPSNTPVYQLQVDQIPDLTYSIPEDCNCNPVLEDEDKSYCFTYGLEQEKHIRLKLDASLIGGQIEGMLFFVYVISSGQPCTDVPYVGNSTIMGTVAHLYPMYQSMMKSVKEIENNCCVPKNFIDYILRFKALELCIKTGNYPQAIKYWNKYFKGKMGRPRTNCSCYG